MTEFKRPEPPSEAEIQLAGQRIQALRSELDQVLFGQESFLELVVIGLLARGHILLEGLPGLGKTELVKALGKALGLDIKRIQFTPDLLPGDITGNPIFQEANGVRSFVFQRGPIFSNIVLADEINRASPKTQSAMLEAMQEGCVTSMGTTHELPRPFFVLATQNPIELEGTYPLPEAQLDRFLLKLDIQPAGAAVLEEIVRRREIGRSPEVAAILNPDEFIKLCDTARRIFLPDVVTGFIARLVEATHAGKSSSSSKVRYGASPRAALALAASARARALAQGRMNASFEDVRAMAIPVLQHRIVLDYSAKLEGFDGKSVVKSLLEEIPGSTTAIPKTLSSVDA